MGKKTGMVLAGLGAFLLTVALLSRFYAYEQLAVVPLDQDTVSVSDGPGATIFDIATQEEITLDLESTRKVAGDVEASEAATEELDRDIAIWETSVVTDEPGASVSEDSPPRSATHDRVAFDRHTGEAIDCCDTYLASTADLETGDEVRDTDAVISGQYFKLPFNTQKQTYQFWDGALKDSTDLEYQATEDIQGLTVYKFEQVIEPTDVGDINAPASIFGIDEDGDIQLDRIYANTRTLWIEPETGVIIRGQEAQDVVAEYQGEQVATLTNVVIGYNEETITDNVDTYSSLSSQLKIVRVWVPLLGGFVGLVLLLLGLALLARGASSRRGVRTA
jgi:hypothetical protein